MEIALLLDVRVRLKKSKAIRLAAQEELEGLLFLNSNAIPVENLCKLGTV